MRYLAMDPVCHNAHAKVKSPVREKFCRAVSACVYIYLGGRGLGMPTPPLISLAPLTSGCRALATLGTWHEPCNSMERAMSGAGTFVAGAAQQATHDACGVIVVYFKMRRGTPAGAARAALGVAHQPPLYQTGT